MVSHLNSSYIERRSFMNLMSLVNRFKIKVERQVISYMCVNFRTLLYKKKIFILCISFNLDLSLEVLVTLHCGSKTSTLLTLGFTYLLKGVRCVDQSPCRPHVRSQEL